MSAFEITIFAQMMDIPNRMTEHVTVGQRIIGVTSSILHLICADSIREDCLYLPVFYNVIIITLLSG